MYAHAHVTMRSRLTWRSIFSESDLQHWMRIMFIIYMFLHAKRTALCIHCEAIASLWTSCNLKVIIFISLFFCLLNFRCIRWNGTFFPLEFFFRIYLPFQFYHWNSIERKRTKNSNKIYWNGKILEIIGSDESWGVMLLKCTPCNWIGA